MIEHTHTVIVTRPSSGRNATTLRTVGIDVAPWSFPEWFVISQTAIPAILYLPGTQLFRLPLRIASFGISLVALAWWWQGKHTKRVAPHPAEHWLIMALGYLVLMIFHPTTNTALAGIAQVMLYLAVLAPVFWAPPLIRGPQHLLRLLGILLVCNGINAMVGVLQVYDPDYWMPKEFSNVAGSLKYGLDAVSYINSAGRRVVRPPGLFDNPGAVCGAGMIAALLGLIFSMSPIHVWKRVIALAFAFVGMAAVYLSQVRTSLLILGGMLLVYVGFLYIQKQKIKATAILGIAVLLGTTVFSLSIAFGGTAISKRFSTLTEDDPVMVYYKAQRGNQMEHAFTTLLPEYPLGAGLGRWGMMRYYFGDESNINSPLIWAELQIPAWILDGGVILVILYCFALLVTAIYEIRLVKTARSPGLRLLAPIVIAANMGTLALIFGFTPFTTQLGLQYWFLVGALYAVARGEVLPSDERLRTGQRRFHYVGRYGPGQL